MFFLSCISFIAVEFTTFWFIFLSIYLFSMFFDHKDIYRIFVFHVRGLILQINGRKKIMGRKITLFDPRIKSSILLFVAYRFAVGMTDGS